MRKSILVFAFIAVSGCAPATPPPPPSAMLKAQLETPTSLAILRQSAGGGQMVVECMLDGAGKYCLVDSGAQQSQVNADDPAIQQYPSLGSSFENSIDGRAARSYDLIDIASLSVLGKNLTEVPFAREGIGSFPDGLTRNGISGVIASDVLSRFSVQFDFPRRQIHLDQPIPSSLRRNELTVLPSHHAVMSMELGGTQASGLWDTGSFITVVDEQFVQEHPSSFANPKDSDFSIEDGTGKGIHLKLYRVKNLKIGSLTLRHLTVGATSLAQFNSLIAKPVQFLIGYNALVRHDWYLDFPNKQWSVE